MKVIIVGKNGQLGEELEKEGKSQKHEVFAFDRVGLDVSNTVQLREKIEEIKPQLFINATAYNLVPQAEENFKEAFNLNSFAVYEMARLCKEAGAAFVTYSTDYVFDGKKDTPYEETDEANPLQKYGMSKASGELATLDTYPENSFVIRTCALYGGQTGSRAKGGNIVLSLLNAAREKDYLEMISDNWVNPTYSKNLSLATYELLAKNPNPGIYHLASEGKCTWKEFAEELLRVLNIQKEVRGVKSSDFPSPIKRPANSVLANTKAKELGVVLPTWQETLKLYISDFGLSLS